MRVWTRVGLAAAAVAALGAGTWWLVFDRGQAPIVTPELVRQNNRAVGLMGQYDFDAAVEAFGALDAATPRWVGSRLNLAIALVNRQGPEDEVRAESLLRELVDVEPIARRARYMLGILLTHEGRDDEALPLLSGVADGEPPDGFAAYFVGQLKLGVDPADALEWFRRAIAREPLLRSAYYGAFLALRRLQRDDEAASMLAEFQALERHPQALVAEFKYTRMGPLSQVITAEETPPAATGAPTGPRFLPPRALLDDARVAWRSGGAPRSITVADIDNDGAFDLFVADALSGPARNAVLTAHPDRFELDLSHSLARVPDVRAALWGDLDDDGRTDVVLCRPAGGAQIWLQESAGVWRDVTASSSALTGMDVVDGAVFDADHDGDLDIWLVNAAGPNELLNNDGGGRFRAIGATAGIGGDGRPSLGIAVADLDGDRDADVIVLKAAPPHDVFLNGRVWQYRRDESAAELSAAPLSALVAGDLDADGEVELYTAGPRGLERWRLDVERVWRAERLSVGADADGPLALADTDGDGRLELLATSAGGWTVYDAAGSASGWTRVGAADSGMGATGGWTVAHLDPSAGPSLVGIGEDGAPRIWAPGQGRYAFVGLSFTGRDPSSDQRRSNVSGVGARVAVRVGSRWTAFDTTRRASGPGQSLQPETIGLGGASRADFVSITWSDGVFQTELALDGGQLHRIAETQRQLSSCPVLFTWDGSGYRFVTDLLGTGGIGFFERPGAYSTPFPRENVLLPVGALAPADGLYRVRMAEPMEEITYLDSLSLVAYDLPPGWKMVLDERKAIAGPMPTGDPIFYREERAPARAVDDAGKDVTAALSDADLSAVGPREVDPRFIGLARPYAVTMTFDAPIDRGPGRPVLIVDGWVEYPYAQTVFAAWQAGAAYEAPTLEARDAQGRWHEVAHEFGYPAGMPRRMAFPLPGLPSGTTALRLRTSQEIYWDRVAVAYREPAPAVRRRVLEMRAAELEAGGFARRTTGPQRVPHYDDARRAPLGDTRHPRGWYTEFGRVDALVAEEDAAVAIFGPGEALTVGFEALEAPPSDGWTRLLVLEARGWCKDMDLYTRDGETVEPLPGDATPARARLHPRFNTRYASGH